VDDWDDADEDWSPPNRCQFHQYFTSSFFIWKVFLRSFYVLTIWVCNFLAKGFWAQNLVIKCRRNWHQNSNAWGDETTSKTSGKERNDRRPWNRSWLCCCDSGSWGGLSRSSAAVARSRRWQLARGRDWPRSGIPWIRPTLKKMAQPSAWHLNPGTMIAHRREPKIVLAEFSTIS
jgi:hypothetical protein